MAREDALAMVNTLHAQLAGFARACVAAMTDGKITPMEGMQLSMQALVMGTTLTTLLQGTTPELRRDVLQILEHGYYT
jgi:imidazolonepropionase-like amidohydrolase